MQVEILLSKLQAERTQTGEPKLIFNFLLSFGWLVLHVGPMQMILLYALLSLLFLLFLALKSKFLETSKKEYFFSFLGTADRGLLSSWKAFLLLQLAYWVRAVENLGGGLVLICRTRERRSGWVKLVWLHECLPSVGERCLPSLWPGHRVFDLCFPCDEPLTSRSTVWTLSHRSYLLAKVRAMKHTPDGYSPRSSILHLHQQESVRGIEGPSDLG